MGTDVTARSKNGKDPKIPQNHKLKEGHCFHFCPLISDHIFIKENWHVHWL